MAKKVTAIPATLDRMTAQPILNRRKRRVAGYARVSTDKEEQQSSYAAQMDYYTNYIGERSDWEFVGMYADEGITATNTKHRDGFNQMVEDALAGKIDLIITKSVSRFARNTVDSLTTVRKLKDKGIEIYFEKENIWTLDSKGELLITIMSSLAQEESRSISENTTWGQRRRFAEGKASAPYSHFLGYDQNFKINEEQAETVRLIYKLYLSGLSCRAIHKKLEADGVPAPAGGKKWYADTIKSILTNEKYKGDALLQKRYTVDFLSKKTVINNGEVPQYYVENHHEGIVTAEEFEEVQAEMRRREGIRYSGVNFFSSKIVCGDCGGFFGSKVWHSTDKYRKVIWRCNRKYKKGEKKCRTPHLTEDEIKAAFLKALNSLRKDKAEIISNMEILLETMDDAGELEAERTTLETEITVLVERTQEIIAENARTAQDQTEYEKRYNAIVRQYEEKKARYDEVDGLIAAARAQRKNVENFIHMLWEMDGAFKEFDSELWGSMVETVTVQTDGSKVFAFKGGCEVAVE